MKSADQALEWKTIKRTTVFQSSWMRLEESECELPSGKIIKPYYVTHSSDFVVIVAVTEDGSVLLERQFRQGIEKVVLEIPAGAIEPGETKEQAARRELEEETGYKASEVEFLFKLAPNAASSSTYAWCYLARNVKPSGRQKLDETEELEVFPASADEVREMLGKGEFLQAVHAAALYRALELCKL